MAPNGHGTGRRVLVVEHGDTEAARLQGLLRAANLAMDLVRVRTAAEAAAALSRQRADLVFVALPLPDATDWAALEALCRTSDLSVWILMSDAPEDATILRALAAGAADVLPRRELAPALLQRSLRYALGRLAAMEALRRSRDELEASAHARNRELETANEQLRRANARLSHALEELKRHEREIIRCERLNALAQMAGAMLRDFNNLLTPIVGYAEMLLENPAMLNDKAAACDVLSRIREASVGATAAIRRMSHFCGPAAEEERTLVHVNRLVEQVVDLTRPRWHEEMKARGCSIRIVKDFDPVPGIRGHQGQLLEGLTNIVLNAVDAMPQGGVLTFRTLVDGDNVTVEVTDTGCGMAEHVRQRCCEPFFSTKGSHATGLGLSLAHGIVRGHGGTMEIDSREGEGTRVCLHLPARSEIPPAESVPPQAGARMQRILIMDDDEQVRRLLETYFTRRRHAAETAASAAEGLRKLREGAFDVVITDRAMPDMSGDDLALAVRQAAPALPVVMLSGFGAEMNARRTVPAGVDRVVAKPVAVSELEAVVNDAIRARTAAGP